MKDTLKLDRLDIKANRMQLDSPKSWYAGTSDISLKNVWSAIAFLFGASVAIRLANLDSLPWFDEFYTILAARGWLIDGVPRIAEGVYDRAELYTALTAWFFKLFGESLVVARLPALIAGSLLVVAVFIWTRWVAGNLAAWIAALFVCLSPLSIQMSQFARFYALFGLMFWLAAVAVYTLFSRRLGWGTAVPLAVAGGLGLLIALHLQPLLALIGLAGVLLWLAVAVGAPRLLLSRRTRPLVFWGVVGVLIVLTAVAAAAVIWTSIGEELLQRYRWTPLHALSRRNHVWFYHINLIERYPTLWPLFPFTALLAIAVRPRPALFCLSIFVPAFALLSFGGMKHLQYLFFVMPYLFVIWSIALAECWIHLRRWVVATTDEALRRVAPTLPRRPARWVLVTAAFVFLIFANGAPARTILIPFGLRLGAGAEDAQTVDWAAARPELEPWLDAASVVLATQEPHVLYYLGRYDVAVSASRLSEYRGSEFDLDPRTGRPVISTPESLELVMACYPSGVLLTTSHDWRHPAELTGAVADVVMAEATPIDLPKNLRILAFWWERDHDTAVPNAACETLPDIGSGRVTAVTPTE